MNRLMKEINEAEWSGNIDKALTLACMAKDNVEVEVYEGNAETGPQPPIFYFNRINFNKPIDK